MRASITVVGILVAALAAAEAPEVEARLEEAAAAADALERVLSEKQAVGGPRCPGGDCRPAEMNRRPGVQEPEATREHSSPDDMAPGGKGSAGGMGGMGRMHPGGMGRLRGMGGMDEPEAVPTASGDPPDTSTRGANEGEASAKVEDRDDLTSDEDPSAP